MGKAELKIDAELLAQAEAAGIRVTEVAERAVREALSRKDPAAAEASARQWAEENAEAIKAHREQIEKYGVFGDDFRAG